MALIFDCDGVLLDSMRLHASIESLALCTNGILIDEATLIRRFAGISHREVLATLSKETGVQFNPNFDLDALKYEAFTTRLQAVPYMAETLAKLTHLTMCVGFRIKPIACSRRAC
jgi:beta-phosphoglucomutase-like phosphatase (HAD superfamily)